MIKRYDINSEAIDPRADALITSEDGDYVLYSEVAHLEKQRDELLEALKENRFCGCEHCEDVIKDIIKSTETPSPLSCSMKDGRFEKGERNG